MKRFLRMAASAAFVLLLSACARHKIIPDDTLAQIFHDAFLTNAYIGSEGVKTDSLRIYEPIFARYGYTTDDVHYTIGNFSKRKSARLGDVVERAIEMLEREGKIYNQEVAVLDTIDNVARRTFTRTVLADSLIRVGSLRDTARLSFTLDVEPGEYSLSLKYLVDSLDRNQRGLKGSVWLERRDSSRTNVYTTTLRRNREESFSRRFTTDTTHRRLRIDFLTFNARPERPSVTVTDLKVEYIPPTRTAVEKLYVFSQGQVHRYGRELQGHRVVDFRRVQERQPPRFSGSMGCCEGYCSEGAVQQAPVRGGCILRCQQGYPHGHPLCHGSCMAGTLRHQHVHQAHR